MTAYHTFPAMPSPASTAANYAGFSKVSSPYPGYPVEGPLQVLKIAEKLVGCGWTGSVLPIKALRICFQQGLDALPQSGAQLIAIHSRPVTPGNPCRGLGGIGIGVVLPAQRP